MTCEAHSLPLSFVVYARQPIIHDLNIYSFDCGTVDANRRGCINILEINLVQAHYELLSKKNSPSAHALVSDGRGGGGGRGRPGGKRGGQGGGRGNSGKNGCTKKDKNSGSGGDAAEAEKQPAKGPICFNCRGRGHFARD